MLDHKPVSEAVMQMIVTYFILNIFIVTSVSLVMAGMGLDFIGAGASVVACLFNIGPGLGLVGPTHNYA